MREDRSKSAREKRTALYERRSISNVSAPSLISRMVSVDVKHHVYLLTNVSAVVVLCLEVVLTCRQERDCSALSLISLM